MKRITLGCKCLSRPQVEHLYTAYVRGKLNYAVSLWSKSNWAELVFTTDNTGLRFITGALPFTPLLNVRKESERRLISLENSIIKADLKLNWALRNRPELNSIRHKMENVIYPTNEDDENNVLYEIGYLPFRTGLPDNFSLKQVLDLIPSPPKDICRISWKNERLLSRIRMESLPTKEWAYLCGFAEDPLCRHCALAPETSAHLLLSCKDLNSPFDCDYEKLLYEVRKQNRQFENELIQFVRSKNVFKQFPTRDNLRLGRPT